MDASHTKLLSDLANASTTPLGGIIRSAIAHDSLKLAGALRAGLAAAGYTVAEENHKENRYQCTVRKDGAMIAWGSSGSADLAIEYAMLGAMREERDASEGK